MGRNKGRNKKQASSNPRKEEYDLKSSLNRLNQKREVDGGKTISDFASNENIHQTINSESIASNQGATTGLFLQISDSINFRYDKLKNDILNVSDKIETSTSNLRLEIDGKLDSKVNIRLFNKLFYGAISVIVAIAIIIYTFSYSNILKETNSNKEKVDSKVIELQILNKEIKKIEKDLIDLRVKQNKIENKIRNQTKPNSGS